MIHSATDRSKFRRDGVQEGNEAKLHISDEALLVCSSSNGLEPVLDQSLQDSMR
jgi:hypothetical protein